MARVATGNFKKGINNRPAKVQLLTPRDQGKGVFTSLPGLKKKYKGFFCQCQ